jgi:hypothetical protein
VRPDSQERVATGSRKRTVQKTAAWTNEIATAGLCAGVGLAPLPFGSTDLKVIAVWVLLLSVIAILASVPPLGSRDVVFLASFSTVAVSWGFVVGEQISWTPIFPGLIKPIWPHTSALIGEQLNGTISVARNQPYFAAGSEVACMLSMVCGFLLGRERNGAYLLLQTFASSGLAYAIYGILAFVFWPDYLLWQHKYGYEKSLIATFTNPNVAAVYFGAAAMAWLLMLAKSFRRGPAKESARWRDYVDELFRNPSRWTVICFAASFIVASAMFMTGSRAGSILSLMAISGAAATLFRRELGTRRLLLVFPVVAAGAILVALQIFGGRIEQRFGAEGLFDSGRWHSYLSTLGIIGDHPWLGTGLGTFRWAFPGYRSEDVAIFGVWVQAHSTPLDLASEMGIPFTLLVAIGWLSIFIVLAGGMLGRERDTILPLGAFWIGLLAIVHSEIDFSLQIPGFSIPVCTLVGMGLAQSVSTRSLNLTTKQ